MARRHLRKGEQAIIVGLVDTAMAEAQPILRQLEAVIAGSIVGPAPAELRRSALQAFMNELGRELFTGGELAIITRSDV